MKNKFKWDFLPFKEQNFKIRVDMSKEPMQQKYKSILLFLTGNVALKFYNKLNREIK